MYKRTFSYTVCRVHWWNKCCPLMGP